MGKLGRSRCDRALHSCLSCHETPVLMPLVVWSCGVGNLWGNSGAVLDTDAVWLCCMLMLRFAKLLTQSGTIYYMHAMTEQVPSLQLQPMLANASFKQAAAVYRIQHRFPYKLTESNGTLARQLCMTSVACTCLSRRALCCCDFMLCTLAFVRLTWRQPINFMLNQQGPAPYIHVVW